MTTFPDNHSETRLIKAAEQISKMPAAAAEKAMEDIAHKNGDDFLQTILAHISPLKIADMLKRNDFSNPSILTWIMTPRIISQVIKKLPLFWMGVLDSEKSSVFCQIQKDALDLTVSILIHINHRDKQHQILKYLSHESQTLFFLTIPFIGWDIKKEQTLLIEDPDVDPGTADHLFEVIRWASPATANQIMDYISFQSPSLCYHIIDIWMDTFNDFEKDHNLALIESAMFISPNLS
ncbi:MAG: hypothetical protein PF503_10305 [Desulfobacula sp.]|nr:hypothetical protein [Desulfobacula sp.]